MLRKKFVCYVMDFIASLLFHVEHFKVSLVLTLLTVQDSLQESLLIPR